MERKTKVHAEDGKQELFITREFDLPVDLLFKAHAEADLVSQWMGNAVLKLEPRKHGSYQFEIKNAEERIVFRANGTFHEFIPDKKIIRTFEMETAPFDVQLEFLEFEALTEDTSRLTMQVIYRSADLRNQMLKLPFTGGINMAHNRLQEILIKLKK